MSVVNQPMPAQLLTRWLDSPVGPIEIGVNLDKEQHTIWYIEFVSEAQIKESDNQADHPILDIAERELMAFFSGDTYDFGNILKYQSDYGTEFQRQVWQALTHIPTGETWSYGELANYINRPKAVRAVGAANGKNPLAVIVPCHRVIGANGTLTGYAGGLDRKAKLLEFERQLRG